MKRVALIIVWICVVVTAVFLRFDDLGSRPFHADEATGARIVAQRMNGEGRFNPKHYHGPVLADLAVQASVLKGERGWKTMSKQTLRMVTAIAGVLLVLLPLVGRRWMGDGVALVAAALMSTSPLLVYYSRMFIHESLLVMFGVAAVMVVVRKPKYGLPGVMVGMMYATKETFVISVMAWGMAVIVLLAENRERINKQKCIEIWKEWRMPLLSSVLLAGLVSMAAYTDGFRYFQGALDAVKTFFVYDTVDGHDKPFAYYFKLLLVPDKSGGIWWFATPVVLMALMAYVSTFWMEMDIRIKNSIRFLAYAVMGHLLIYSWFDYKTPWLVCLPWAYVCLLAGFSVHQVIKQKVVVQVLLALLILAALFTQFRQARYATGRLSSDHRNPYAYVPTRKPVEQLEDWLKRLQAMEGEGEMERLAVVGSDYWPLPWYLRAFERVGYWPESDKVLRGFPIVLCMPEELDGAMRDLEDSHHLVPFGYGLRPGVNIEVFVEMDVWEKWSAADES